TGGGFVTTAEGADSTVFVRAWKLSTTRAVTSTRNVDPRSADVTAYVEVVTAGLVTPHWTPEALQRSQRRVTVGWLPVQAPAVDWSTVPTWAGPTTSGADVAGGVCS